METNIVRGREAYGEKERGGEKERQTSALESIRMSEGSERRRMTEGRRERRSGSERVGENERRGRRRYVAAVGGSERAGWLRSTGKREEWKCKRTDYSRREPRGPRGARILGACAAGVGTRAHVQTVSPLSLSLHSPSPSPRSFPPAFSLAYRRCSSLLSTRV